MSTSRDMKRIAKFDGEIMELHYLYQREVAREKELGQRNLLNSKLIKYKLDVFIRARAALLKRVKQRRVLLTTYATGLEYRKADVREAEEEQIRLQQEISIAGSNMLTSPTMHNIETLKDLTRELGVQKSRVASKKRALDNFITKRGQVSGKEPAAKLPRGYNPLDDAEALDKGLDLISPADEFSIQMATKQEAIKVPTRIEDTALAKSPQWSGNSNKAEFDAVSALEALGRAPTYSEPITPTEVTTIDVADAPEYDDKVFEKTTPKVMIKEL